jgi:hypothetical protein
VDAEKISEDDSARDGARRRGHDMRAAKKLSRSRRRLLKWNAVRAALARRGRAVLKDEVTFVPQSTVRVEGKDAPCAALIEALEELDDVQSSTRTTTSRRGHRGHLRCLEAEATAVAEAGGFRSGCCGSIRPRRYGYGVLERAATRLAVLDVGCRSPPRAADLSRPPADVYDGVDRVLAKHTPRPVVIEDLYSEYSSLAPRS